MRLWSRERHIKRLREKEFDDKETLTKEVIQHDQINEIITTVTKRMLESLSVHKWVLGTEDRHKLDLNDPDYKKNDNPTTVLNID